MAMSDADKVLDENDREVAEQYLLIAQEHGDEELEATCKLALKGDKGALLALARHIIENGPIV